MDISNVVHWTTFTAEEQTSIASLEPLSSIEQPRAQEKQPSSAGLATGNTTIAVVSPETLSSIKQLQPQKKQSPSAVFANRNETIAVASPEPLSSIEQPPPQKKQASIVENFFAFPGCIFLSCCTISQALVHRTTSSRLEHEHKLCSGPGWSCIPLTWTLQGRHASLPVLATELRQLKSTKTFEL